MIHLSVWYAEGVVKWQLVKVRPAVEWRRLGPWYWERRGEARLDDVPRDDRAMISAALAAIQDRLGER